MRKGEEKIFPKIEKKLDNYLSLVKDDRALYEMI